MDKISILNQFDFFLGAESILQKRLTSSAQLVRFDAGRALLQRNSHCPQFLLVGSGSIRVFVTGDTGREVTLYRVGAGQICVINMVATLLEMKSPVIAVATKTVNAIAFSGVEFRELVHDSDTVRDFVFKMVATRMMDLIGLVEHITFGKMEQRVAGFLMQQFANEGGKPQHEISTTHANIASELGSAREVVTRLLKQFGERGAIEVGRQKIILRDEQLLRALQTQDP